MTTREDACEVLVRHADGRVLVASPAPGLFTCALPRGAVLVPGATCGVLLALGRARRLVVPATVEGRVLSQPPERVRAPVGFGDVLYELAPLATSEAAGAAGAAGAEVTRPADGDLVVRSEQSGRFYQRPAPGADPFVRPGDVVEPGRPIGLIEVMKTFTHVTYRDVGSLPARARVVSLLVGDGEDVHRDQALLEVEPA